MLQSVLAAYESKTHIFRDGLSWMDTNTHTGIRTDPRRLQPLCVRGFSQTKGLSSKTNSGKHGNGNERDVETDASARRKGKRGKMCRCAYPGCPVFPLCYLAGTGKGSCVKRTPSRVCTYVSDRRRSPNTHQTMSHTPIVPLQRSARDKPQSCLAV